jgi:signal recognition particle GTPase
VLLIYFVQHITGRPSTEYVSEETPMAAYANVHIAFEQMRVRALRIVHGSPASDDDANANAEPPRVLVLGPENSGKTTVCKILTNYAVRAGQNWSPVLVNVDPSEVSMQGMGLIFFIESRVRVGGQFLEQSRPLRFAVL